jgi:ketosteroid isomerase-like protein
MKMRVVLAILALFTSVLSSSPALAQQASIQNEIRDLEEKWNAAYAVNDLPVYFAYYAPDCIQWLPDGYTDLPHYEQTWTDYIKQGGRIEAARLADMHIQVNPSGDTAIASYLLHVKERSPKGVVTDEEYQESDVWFKRADGWKVVHLHYSHAPKK